MQREHGVPCEKEARESLWRGEKRSCGKFWGGKRGCGNKGLPVKKEAVENSGAREAAGTRGSSGKKRLWEIMGQERLREQVVPSEKRGCGKFWGKRGCGNEGFPVKKGAMGNSGEKDAAGTRGSL